MDALNFFLCHGLDARGSASEERRIDAPAFVDAARAAVLVGRVGERADRHRERVIARDVRVPDLLQRLASVQAARARRLELRLLVAAAGDVVLPDATDPAPRVVPGEDRYHHEPLHRSGQIGADHLRKLVGLAVEFERLALDLLVVFEFDAQQFRHLDAARRTGDGDQRMPIGGVDLLHVARGHPIALGGQPITRDDDAVPVAHRKHRSAMRDAEARRGQRARR